MSALDQKTLREYLYYCQHSGIFTWIKKPARRIVVGSPAGSCVDGWYVNICLLGAHYKAHRLAWLYMTGYWPAETVDHINRNKSDNRWANLRQCSRSENLCNRGIQSNNTTGFKGVVYRKSDNKYQARVKKNGKTMYFGLFDTAEAAAETASYWRDKLHGKYSSHE